jgi:TPR repeat protein
MLTQAPTTKQRQQSVTSRSTQTQTPTWYLSLQDEEWAELEYQIGQRAEYITEDEIPQLNYRADTGNVIAMTTLALAYRDGFRQSYTNNAGAVYRTGASNTQSLSWLFKAAEAGFPIAQRELGEMHLLGTGTDFDRDTGLHWLERAAQSNYPLARLNLAQRLYDSNPTAETSQNLWVTIQEQANVLQRQQMKQLHHMTVKHH